MYVFEGNTIGKSQLALAVITNYCAMKPRTMEDVQTTFTKFVIADEKRAKSLAQTSGRRRHFLDYPIKLKTGVGFVSNQWRLDTIEELIKVAKGLGMKITVSKGEATKPTPKKAAAKKVAAKKVPTLAEMIGEEIDKIGKSKPKLTPKKAVKKPVAKKVSKKK